MLIVSFSSDVCVIDLTHTILHHFEVDSDIYDIPAHYDVDIDYNGVEYEYKIDGVTGAILEHEADYDD